MTKFRFIALLTVTLAAPAGALAQEPRLGTLACVTENAFMLNPATGDSGSWGGHQRSFVVKVSTCADVVAEKFKIALDTLCDGALKSSLVITTTLKDEEDGWFIAHPGGAQSGGRLQGGVFNSALLYPNRTQSAPRLILRTDLSFDYIVGAESETDDGLAWWTMQGHCTHFDAG